jgi:hypothetical protein
MKTEIIKKYLDMTGYWDKIITTDHIAGWENKNGLIPDHLTGDRYFNFKKGQVARKLRDNDWVTHIFAKDGKGNTIVNEVYAGRMGIKKIIKICEKAGATQDITAYICDRATNKQTIRNIGY